MNDSYFDGKLLQLIGLKIVSFIVIVCSLGILYPLAGCWMYNWKVKHTVIALEEWKAKHTTFEN